MFSEYLSTEIKLLEEIKEGIDDNFNTPSTIFKFWLTTYLKYS